MTATAAQDIRHQRSTGAARVGLALRHGIAAVATLEQTGCARAFVLPGPEVVFLNTAGGLTGGDMLSAGLDIPAGARVTATTQTAERLYRAAGGTARIAVSARVGAGARLDWLPQETILFEGCRARRRTEIDLGPGATCLMAETLILGRAAMGETPRRPDFRDWRQISRGGVPVHLDPVAIGPGTLGPGPAGTDGARALASVVLVGPGAENALGPVRALMPFDGVRAAASGWDGRLAVRLMAGDGWPLRRALAALLRLLCGRPLPRVWQV
ncbi:MAG: urease accessory protein UreD [Gemmobacter sp.]